MQFTNINFLTISIFTTLFIVILFLGYIKYYNQVEFNKKYKLIKSFKYFYIKYLFLAFSLIIILFGIFGIMYGDKKIKSNSKGIDVMFTLDVSKSMNVSDIMDGNYKYKRLDISKKAIADFVIKNSENRFGLIIFAGDATSTIPLTTDHNLFLTFLNGVDYRNLTVQGSDFEKAINLSIERFIGDNERSKALVFISDGGDTGDKTNFKIESNKDITFSVVGVGTKKGGQIIKGVDFFGKEIYQQYKGKNVISKLNTDNLKDISSNLGGDFIKLEKVSDLEKLNKSFSKLNKKVFEKKVNGELSDFSRILSIISFILFITYITVYIFEEKITKIKIGKK